MPHKVILKDIPAGYALTNAVGGDMIDVARTEFTSSEDGSLFISRLEGIPRMLLSLIPDFTPGSESAIDHMLAIIHPDKTAIIYVNELEFIASARIKRDVKKGEIITLDDILDIERISIKNVTVGLDEAMVFVFSCGWRKGLFFDLRPLPPSGIKRDYDFESTFAFYNSYLQLSACLFAYRSSLERISKASLVSIHLFAARDSQANDRYYKSWSSNRRSFGPYY